MRSGWGRAASWVLLFWDRFSVSKLLSQIQRSTLWLLQGLSQRPSFGGFGLRELFVWMAMFQSSSSQKAGCNQGPLFRLWSELTPFQSSSSQKAGCNVFAPSHAVSQFLFQSSSSQKAGCNSVGTLASPTLCGVSILIQPEGRMQPQGRFTGVPRDSGFNPHPARRPDATLPIHPDCVVSERFNPHPARRPDATYLPELVYQSLEGFNPHPARRPDATATLGPTGQPWARFQSSSSQKAGCNHRGIMKKPLPTGFNPHPARRPDATARQQAKPAPPNAGFNPHPARRPDATGRAIVGPARCQCFNPHPARRPDATRMYQPLRYIHQVSILIQPEGRMQREASNAPRPPRTVSILIQPEGRMQRPGGSLHPSDSRSFNPHPARRPDATLINAVAEAGQTVFQSSSSQKAGCNVDQRRG